MVYLVKLDGAYKIGYSNDVVKRIKTLQVTHLESELVCVREGDASVEKAIHSACSEYHIKNELFKIDNNVVSLFKKHSYGSVLQENIELKEKNKGLEKRLERARKIVALLQEKNTTLITLTFTYYQELLKEMEKTATDYDNKIKEM